MNTILLPLLLSAWIKAPLPNRSFPEITSNLSGWTLKTKESAGGYVYLLPKALPLNNPNLKLTWKWSIEEFPKSGDDYAVRIGLLLSTGLTSIRSIARMNRELGQQLASRNEEVSHVVFITAVKEKSTDGVCEKSKQMKEIFICRKGTGEPQLQNLLLLIRNSLAPSEETLNSIKLLGFWILADSDDSKSTSSAFLSDLRIEYP